MTNREIAEYTLDRLKKAGADGASVGVSRGSTDELNVDGGEFSLMRTLFNSGLSMKALVDGKKGNAAINRLDKDAIDEAVASCIASARSGKPDEAERIAPCAGEHDFASGAEEPDLPLLYDRMQEMLDGIRQDYPTVMIEQAIVTFDRAEGVYMNTNGTVFTSRSGDYGLSNEFSAHEGELASSFNGYGWNMYDLNRPFLELDRHRELLDASARSVHTRPIEGKFVGPVVMTPGFLGNFLGSVIGNFLSDSVIIDGTSLWLDQLGKQVASAGLNVSSIPLDPRIVDGERFSGGFLSENMDYLVDGVLQSFALGDYASRKTGYARAKNQSMNLWVKPGEQSLEELIRGIDRGLLVDRFSGGEPAQNGDFSGVAKNSFLIENGKIAGAVSETMVSGNFCDILNRLVGISRETVCDGGSVLPWAVFGGVTISGK